MNRTYSIADVVDAAIEGHRKAEERLLPQLQEARSIRATTASAYDTAMFELGAALRDAQHVRSVLEDLVRLKDGPRDDAYRAAKDAAWDKARVALRLPASEAGKKEEDKRETR